MLWERGLTLATMESCTGGLLASTITDVPGSSDYFKGGLISYTTEVKLAWGVSREVVEAYGVISVECAREMARVPREVVGGRGHRRDGRRRAGRAGREGGGPVHIALDDGSGDARVVSYQFAQSREMVKRRAVTTALSLLRRTLARSADSAVGRGSLDAEGETKRREVGLTHFDLVSSFQSRLEALSNHFDAGLIRETKVARTFSEFATRDVGEAFVNLSAQAAECLGLIELIEMGSMAVRSVFFQTDVDSRKGSVGTGSKALHELLSPGSVALQSIASISNQSRLSMRSSREYCSCCSRASRHSKPSTTK